MSEQKPIHLLQAGQELSVRFREAQGQVLSNLTAMRLTPNGGNPYASFWVTFVDVDGISLYITRGHSHGGDIQAFLPRDAVTWQSYFEALRSFNAAYASSGHFKKRFPLEFI